MPYLNISFWLLVGAIIGWFAHSIHLANTSPSDLASNPARQNNTAQVPRTTADPLEQQLSEHILKGDMRAAMDTYSDIAQQNPQKKKRIDTQILEQVERLLNQGENTAAQNLLAEYLKTNAYNPNALLLQAKIHYFGKKYMSAVASALEAKIYARSQTLINRADALIDEIAEQYEKFLRTTKQWAQMEQFFFFLTEQDPDTNTAERLYKIGYAQYRQGLLEAALNTLDALRYDQSLGDRAESLYGLADQLNSAEGNIVAIPIRSNDAGQWVVDAVINGKLAALIIDTGASLTVLDKEQAIALEIYSPDEEPLGIERTTVKTTSDVSDIVVLSETTLEIGEISLSNTTLGIMDMPLDESDVYDGLLGMDFLSFFEFQIDQTNAVLKLQP